MKRTHQSGKLSHRILFFIYIPLSFFSFLLMMASEGTMDATNLLYIRFIEIVCVIAFLIPFLCIASIFLSTFFSKKGYILISWLISCLPLFLFILNLILLAFTESLPKNI